MRADVMRAEQELRDLRRRVSDLEGDLAQMAEAMRMHEVGSAYAHRLAIMLECALLDRPGTWEDGHALLDEYRAACRAAAPEAPTFLGAPVVSATARESLP
jgi:hypothetical protein